MADILEAIDRAVADYSVSSDAMRSTPEPVDAPLMSVASQFAAAFRPITDAMTLVAAQLEAQFRRFATALDRLVWLGAPTGPVRDRPSRLVVDGGAYRRRVVARRRRSR